MTLIGGMPFEPVRAGEYEQQCASREICVHIHDERAKTLLLGACRYKKGDDHYGLTVVKEIPELRLKPGDFAVPSDRLIKIRDVFTQATPFQIMFWRTVKDPNGLRFGIVVRRSPLFVPALGLEPSSAMAVDFMHTICFGTIQRLISCIVWRIVFANVFGCRGSKESKIDGTFRQLREDLQDWYVRTGTPHDQRLTDLSPKMLGGEPHLQNHSFGGGHMRLKAHETLCFLPFVVEALRPHMGLSGYSHLLAAGESMLDFLGILSGEGMRVPDHKLQNLLDLMQLHLVRCDLAGLAFVPKHHFAAELVARTVFSVRKLLNIHTVPPPP
eukprot:8059620-Pyramimonas_sp.AAC.2